MARLESRPRRAGMKKSAYVWTREHAPERLCLLDDVRDTWTDLFGERGDCGHYASIQYCAGKNPNWQRFEDIEDAKINGRRVKAFLHVISARDWYARELYLRSLAKTRARYPDFDAHRFVDGDRLGERRIEFLNERHALSFSHLYCSLTDTYREENPVIYETCFFAPCGSYGARSDIRWGSDPDPNCMQVTLILNTRNVFNADLSDVIADLKEGRVPSFPPEPVVFSPDDIWENMVELSDPELVLLNWKDALAPLSEVDEALWKAALALDVKGVEQALAAGANVNSLQEGRSNLVSEIIKQWREYCNPDSEIQFPEHWINHDQLLSMIKSLLDAGTHPDLTDFDSFVTTAMSSAVLCQDREIAAMLLDYGADPAIHPSWSQKPCFDDPEAWDYALTDGFCLDEKGVREVYYEMIKRRSSPLFEQSEEDRDRLEAMSQLPPDKNQTD
jgi:hypothetical protein